MNINYIDQGFDCVIIDDFFTREELALLQHEAQGLTLNGQMQASDQLKSAWDERNPEHIVANRKGIFLESVFREWRMSNLIRIPHERLKDADLAASMCQHNSLWRMFTANYAHSHLLNYYEDTDYYDWHEDSTIFTVLCWFCQEPQEFTGGDFVIRNSQGQEQTIEYRTNRVVIIPSCTPHRVTPVAMQGRPYSGKGRYSLTVFVATWPVEEQGR